MITQHEFQQRRQQLAQQLPNDSIALIASGKEMPRNGDTHFRFRQSSDFYYFTGFNEPEAILLIIGGDRGKSYLFNRKKNSLLEQWTGKRLGQEHANKQLGVTGAYPIDELANHLLEFLTNQAVIYYDLSNNELKKIIFNTIQTLKNQIRRGITVPNTLSDLEPLISEMRLFKSEAELNLMRQANSISIAAHKRAMKACTQLNFEYQLEAELIHEFMSNGCRNTAYDSIVGSGANACILHYTDNNQPLTPGDLVLVDAGCELENYAADITRTYPINGQFTAAQRSIYELVLKAQQAGINSIKPGLPWNKIQETMVQVLTEGLVELNILKGKLSALIAKEAYKPFYMHSSGHWLGLDVHDSGRYKLDNEWRPLQPGMVLTVEPGLYIPAASNIDKRWWNIGVRIEDDILVTTTGYENLTRDLPVSVNDIEALMRG